MEIPDTLYRFGLDYESAEALELACENALARGYPHGISVRSEGRHDASEAERIDLELYFTVLKTGKSELHFTLVLPHPVTEEDARHLNDALGRRLG
jgi:hypothetical protein